MVRPATVAIAAAARLRWPSVARTRHRHAGSHEADRCPDAAKIDRRAGCLERESPGQRDPWNAVGKDDVHAGRRTQLRHVKNRQSPRIVLKEQVAAQGGRNIRPAVPDDPTRIFPIAGIAEQEPDVEQPGAISRSGDKAENQERSERSLGGEVVASCGERRLDSPRPAPAVDQPCLSNHRLIPSVSAPASVAPANAQFSCPSKRGRRFLSPTEQQLALAQAIGCPSSDDLRHISGFQKGGSGSS